MAAPGVNLLPCADGAEEAVDEVAAQLAEGWEVAGQATPASQQATHDDMASPRAAQDGTTPQHGAQDGVAPQQGAQDSPPLDARATVTDGDAGSPSDQLSDTLGAHHVGLRVKHRHPVLAKQLNRASSEFEPQSHTTCLHKTFDFPGMPADVVSAFARKDDTAVRQFLMGLKLGFGNAVDDARKDHDTDVRDYDIDGPLYIAPKNNMRRMERVVDLAQLVSLIDKRLKDALRGGHDKIELQVSEALTAPRASEVAMPPSSTCWLAS